MYEHTQETTPLARSRAAYDGFHKTYQNEVGHYFRNFYRILKFVHESDVKNKSDYTGILRAQLSSYELVLMFYSALHPVGENLRRRVEEYAMFDNLDLELLFSRKDDVGLFEMSAYGKTDDTTGKPKGPRRNKFLEVPVVLQ